MADTAFQVQYRDEAIMGFEQGISYLRSAVTTETVIKGNQATFLVADSGTATAKTRGVNGLIPARADNLNQYTASLVESHDLVRKTSFNIFASQGDQRRIMQLTTRKVMNKKIDQDILVELQNATLTTGAAATASLALVTKALTILGNNEVDVEEEDNMFFVASPAFQAYLLQIPEFSKADYVEIKPLVGPARRMRRWAGFNWIFHPKIVGKGTALEYCYAFHRSSIGHAVNTGDMQALAGYMEEQDYSWARTSAFMGSKLLQNNGVVVVKHDGSAYVAS
ncbi:MAG: phage capsid protein [Pseudomonadota bacterium]